MFDHLEEVVGSSAPLTKSKSTPQSVEGARVRGSHSVEGLKVEDEEPELEVEPEFIEPSKEEIKSFLKT